MVNVAQVTEVADDQSQTLTKVYGLIVGTTLLALAAGYLFSKGFLLFGLITLFVYFSLFVLKLLFVSNKNLLIAGTLINAAAVAFPFFKSVNSFFIISFALLIVFMLTAVFRGRRETENMMKVHLFRVTRIITSSLVTAFIIFLGAMVVIGGNFSVSRDRVDQTLRILVAPFAGRYIPEFSPEMSTRKLLADFSERSIIAESEIGTVPEGAREILIDKAVVELHERIENSLGTDVNIDASVGANVQEIIMNKLNDLTPTAKLYWGIFAIALAWVSLKSIEFVIYIPLALLVFLLYEVALSMNFTKVQMENRSQETISLT